MRKKEYGYYRGSSCKYKLITHIVFVTKFRYKILYGKLDNDHRGNCKIYELSIKYIKFKIIR